MQNLFFILSKFLQMSKLLYNILKISGVKMPPPWLRAWYLMSTIVPKRCNPSSTNHN